MSKNLPLLSNSLLRLDGLLLIGPWPVAAAV